MKKVLYLGLLSAIALTSCKNQVPTPDKFDISPNHISLYYDQEISVKTFGAPEKEVTWETSDDFYVDVDANGRAKACHVGTAGVTAKYGNNKKTCQIDVLPLHTVHSKLYFNWGSKVNEIKAILGTPYETYTSSGTYFLVYKDGVTNGFFDMYGFEDGKLSSVGFAGTITSTTLAEDISYHLVERYLPLGKSDENTYLFVDSNKPDNIKLGVGLTIRGATVAITYLDFTQYTSSPSRGMSENHSMYDKMAKTVNTINEYINE